MSSDRYIKLSARHINSSIPNKSSRAPEFSSQALELLNQALNLLCRALDLSYRAIYFLSPESRCPDDNSVSSVILTPYNRVENIYTMGASCSSTNFFFYLFFYLAYAYHSYAYRCTLPSDNYV